MIKSATSKVDRDFAIYSFSKQQNHLKWITPSKSKNWALGLTWFFHY